MKKPPKPCSKCAARAARPGQAYCRQCHTEYCRQWRPRTFTKGELRDRIELLETTLDTVLAQLGPGTPAWKEGIEVLSADIVSQKDTK